MIGEGNPTSAAVWLRLTWGTQFDYPPGLVGVGGFGDVEG
jgi:hypothetical protein